MALVEIQFTTSARLTCADCLPASVILCIPVSLDANATESSTTGIVEGEITVVETSGSYYVYTIEYDDDQIVEGQTLTSDLIQGIFCVGCLTNWAQEITRRSTTIGAGLLATDATTGFAYIPTMNGNPTGVPVNIPGYAPIVVDLVNNKFFFYANGEWKCDLLSEWGS